MPLAPKVRALKRKVGSNQQLCSGGRAKDGAIIADALYQCTGTLRTSAQTGDDPFFRQGHESSVRCKVEGAKLIADSQPLDYSHEAARGVDTGEAGEGQVRRCPCTHCRVR